MDKTPIEMIRILPDDDFRLAKIFVDLGGKLDCKSKVRFAPGHKTWKCVFSRKKPAKTLYTIDCTESRWQVKACLWNIDAYHDVLAKCSDNIKNTIIHGYDCKTCNTHCKGGAGFTFNNIRYQKCVGIVFVFSNLCEGDWNDLASLIVKEYEATCSV